MNNWLTSTFQSIREKSLDAFEFVRKDLSEFTSTVKSDAENYLHKIQIKSANDSTLSENQTQHENDRIAATTVDRVQNERIRVQNDESTYLTDPKPIESYVNWCETNDFTDDKRKTEIAQLLIDSPSIRSFYARFVPACTTHNKFWSRYYYRIHKLDENETRRLNLLKRAHEICNENHENEWDEPTDEWIAENITCEIQQIKSNDNSDQLIDETDLSTSKSCTAQLNTSTVMKTTTSNKPDNEFEDEWETWS